MEIIIGIAVLVVLSIIALSTYQVVDANEAHIVVFMGRGRKVYSPKTLDKDGNQLKSKTSYFFFPGFMKRQILPLTNVRMEIDDIHLNDLNVAPFICDVIAWLHIEDPIKAAERLNFHHDGGMFGSLEEDLHNMVNAIARAAAMKQEVLDIMRDRNSFSKLVTNEVDGVLTSWGVELINLEVNEIRDDKDKGSEIISSYELMRRAQIESTARQEVAIQTNKAILIEQENRQRSEIAKTTADEQIQRRSIERDQNIGVAQQEAMLEVTKRKTQTNLADVEATRRLEVGRASVSKEAAIEVATGEAEAIRIKGERQAQVISLTGSAEASATESKGLAEAKAKDAMADALKKFTEAGITLEQIKAAVEVKKAEFEALGKIAANAEIKVVTSGQGGSILGLPLNASTGADLGQMIESFGLDKIKALIGKA